VFEVRIEIYQKYAKNGETLFSNAYLPILQGFHVKQGDIYGSNYYP
jgi:hypothetical protein